MEKILKRDLVFQGRFLRVYRDTVELPSGKEAIREFIPHSGGAVILAKSADNKFLLLKQYRHSLQKDFFEFPAGRRDGNEDFMHTAQRELREETGVLAKNWHPLGKIHPCIGYSDEVIHAFTADDLTEESHAREDGEHIEIFWKTAEEINHLIGNGSMTDAKSLSVWMLYLSSKNAIHSGI